VRSGRIPAALTASCMYVDYRRAEPRDLKLNASPIPITGRDISRELNKNVHRAYLLQITGCDNTHETAPAYIAIFEWISTVLIRSGGRKMHDIAS
jgi:hypothetical protein